MKRWAIISVAVVAAAVALWFGALAFASRWLERRGERVGLSVGGVGVNPFVPAVTLNNISMRLEKDGKPLTINRLRIEKPHWRDGLGARLIVVNRLDTIEDIAFAAGRLTVARVSLLNGDESVRTTVRALLVDTVAHRASLASLALEPTYPKDEFTEKSWRHGDWTQIRIGAVECSGVDLGAMSVDSIHVAGASIASYKDRNLAHLNTSLKPMYHTVLQRFSSRATFRVVSFEGLDVRYEELPAGGDTAGVFTLDDAAGSVRMSGGAVLWTAAGRIMNSAPLAARGTLPLEGDDFELSGSLGECPAAAFNPLSTPLGGIEIRGGHLRRLDFSVAGDSIRARSEVSLGYDSLAVELFSRHHHDRKLLSEIVDAVLPHCSATAAPVAGNFARDPHRSVWNYIWKTIFDAVKKTAVN
jgi:hypothetical protein